MEASEHNLISKILARAQEERGDREKKTDYDAAHEALDRLHGDCPHLTYEMFLIIEWCLWADRAAALARGVFDKMGVSNPDDPTYVGTPEEEAWQALWSLREELPDLIKHLLGLPTGGDVEPAALLRPEAEEAMPPRRRTPAAEGPGGEGRPNAQHPDCAAGVFIRSLFGGSNNSEIARQVGVHNSTIHTLVIVGEASDRTLRLIAKSTGQEFGDLRKTVDELNAAELSAKRARGLVEEKLGSALAAARRA